MTEAQKTYGTVEEANAANKTPTAIQEALHVQQRLVDEIAKATAGTEEYNNAVKAAEDNWKNVMIAINSSKKQKTILFRQLMLFVRDLLCLKKRFLRVLMTS